MRKFALVIFNENSQIIDRINIDLVQNPTGFGFSLNISTIKTDVIEVVTKCVQNLQPIKLNVLFAKGNVYQKSETIRRFIEQYTNSNKMALEYDNGVLLKYIDCLVQDFDLSEKDEFQSLTIPITIKPLSPFYRIVSNEITIKPAESGKAYPHGYPYGYGSGTIENNEIKNTYIKEIPLVITIYGEMSNPLIVLKDEDDEIYDTLEFEALTLAEGEHIIIDSINRKIKLWRSGVYIDGYNYLNPEHSSFLYAKGNITSKLSVNLNPSLDGYLTANFRLYGI